MRISTLRTKLKCHGWHKYVGKTVERWYMGDALLTIDRNAKNAFILSLPEGECRKLEELKHIEFTRFRVLLQWIDDHEWYVMY